MTDENFAEKDQEQVKGMEETKTQEKQNAPANSAAIPLTRAEQVHQRAEKSRKAALNKAVEPPA